MTTGIVVDFSFAHAEVTADRVKQIPGIEGFVAYAGSYGGDKNITKGELHALLDAGLWGCLVIEDNAGDLRQGVEVGADQGNRIIAAAKQLGYDWRHCVLATGYDTDAHGGDYSHLLAAMEAFARKVPNPGYYGDSDSIDYLHARHPGWFYWQSNSRSFSPRNPTPNAHLWQQYDHPLAHTAGLGSSVDINFVRRSPLGFMGEGADMPLSDADVRKIVNAVWAHHVAGADKGDSDRRVDVAAVTAMNRAYGLQSDLSHVLRIVQGIDGKVDAISKVVNATVTRVAAAQKSLTDVASQVGAVAAAVAKLTPAPQVTTDVAAIAEAVADKIRSIVWKAGN